MANTDNLVSGAKAGAVGAGGSLFLGPAIGPIAAGYAADQFLDSRKISYTAAGTALTVGILGMSMFGGQSGSAGGVM